MPVGRSEVADGPLLSTVSLNKVLRAVGAMQPREDSDPRTGPAASQPGWRSPRTFPAHVVLTGDQGGERDPEVIK